MYVVFIIFSFTYILSDLSIIVSHVDTIYLGFYHIFI